MGRVNNGPAFFILNPIQGMDITTCIIHRPEIPTLLLKLSLPEAPADVDIINVSEYNPPPIPSKTWRECIKKLWEVDPLLCCPRCKGPMRIISFITEFEIIKQILKHLGLWQQKPSRSPPSLTKTGELAL